MTDGNRRRAQAGVDQPEFIANPAVGEMTSRRDVAIGRGVATIPGGGCRTVRLAAPGAVDRPENEVGKPVS